MTSVLWRRLDGSGLERCTIEQTADGHRVAGTVLLAIDGTPHEIRYSVLTDPQWRTRKVGAHVQSPAGDRRLALSSDGEGSWSATDVPLIDLYGATDVELTWTPATHLVVIRRLDLAVGESGEVTFSVIDYPAHDIGRASAEYTRMAEDTYVLTRAGSEVTLEVPTGGIAISQAGAWEPVATA